MTQPLHVVERALTTRDAPGIRRRALRAWSGDLADLALVAPWLPLGTSPSARWQRGVALLCLSSPDVSQRDGTDLGTLLASLEGSVYAPGRGATTLRLLTRQPRGPAEITLRSVLRSASGAGLDWHATGWALRHWDIPSRRRDVVLRWTSSYLTARYRDPETTTDPEPTGALS